MDRVACWGNGHTWAQISALPLSYGTFGKAAFLIHNFLLCKMGIL